MRAQSRLTQLRTRLPEGLAGGALLLISTTVVNAGNYAYNLIMGRWLGPAAFADASLIVTLFLVITFVTVALQTTTAKFAAVYSASARPAANEALRRWLGRGAWLGGLGLLLIFGLGAPLWQRFFHTSSIWPFVIFALGVPFYIILGVERGMLQGATRFSVLALSFQAEMWARLVIGIALVALGWSVFGAVAGLSLSLVVAWLVSHRANGNQMHAEPLSASERRAIIGFTGPVLAALAGQILINNSDVLIVKHFFSAAEAGLYAALALIGRIVFFATWSVVTVLFPIVARRHHQGDPHRHLLYTGLAIVLLVSAPIVLLTIAVPELIVGLIFGEAYLPMASLLGGYALATTFYALANVVISYRLSLDDSSGSLLALAAGLTQVGLLWLLHADLAQVVQLQVYVMGGLFVALVLWDGWMLLWPRLQRSQPASPTPVQPTPTSNAPVAGSGDSVAKQPTPVTPVAGSGDGVAEQPGPVAPVAGADDGATEQPGPVGHNDVEKQPVPVGA